MLSSGYLLVADKVAISISVNQLNATILKSSKNQFKFQFELSLAQLSPSLFLLYSPAICYLLEKDWIFRVKGHQT